MSVSSTKRGGRAAPVWPLVFAALCGLVLYTHSDSGFDPVRLKLVTHARVAESDGLTIRIPESSVVPTGTTASVLIARVSNPGSAPLPVRISRNDVEIAAVSLDGGETRRFDLAVPHGTVWQSGDRVTLRGSGDRWQLEYLELANVHGSSRRFLEFLIVPASTRASGHPPVLPILTIVLLVAALGIWQPPDFGERWSGYVYRVTSGVALLFLTLVLLSDVLTRFALLVPLKAVMVCIALFCWRSLAQAYMDTSARFGRSSDGATDEADARPWWRDLRLPAALVVVLAIVSVKAGFSGPGLPAGHDVLTHATYTYFFDRALRQGQFPVRWTELVFEGHSQPAFNFYYVGLYHLVEVVHLFQPSLSRSLTTTVVMLWWMGAGFVFLLFKRLGTMPALLAAVVFALSPYLILDVFVRSAYAEFAAIAVAPGLLWVLDRFLRTGKPAFWLGTAFFTGLMLVCHLGTVLIFSPAFAAYVLYLLLTRQAPFTTALQAGGATLLGLNMAAFYVFPAILEMDLINIQLLVTGYGEYQRHFVQPSQWIDFTWGFGSSREGAQDQMSFQIGIGQWLLILVSAASVVVSLARRRFSPPARDLLFWLGVTGFAMFIMTSASHALWRAVPSLAFVQFPWRFSMLISIGCAGLAAVLLSMVRRQQLQAAIVICAAALLVELHADHLKPRGYFPADKLNIDDPNWRNTPEAKAQSFVEHGYYPSGVQPTRLSNTLTGRWTISQGRATVRAVSVRDHELVLDAESGGEFRMTLNTPYFPGWRVWIDGQEARILARQTTAYMEVRVPAGRHRIEARFTNTPLRTYANAISLGSAGLFASLLGWAGIARVRSGERWRRAGLHPGSRRHGRAPVRPG